MLREKVAVIPFDPMLGVFAVRAEKDAEYANGHIKYRGRSDHVCKHEVEFRYSQETAIFFSNDVMGHIKIQDWLMREIIREHPNARVIVMRFEDEEIEADDLVYVSGMRAYFPSEEMAHNFARYCESIMEVSGSIETSVHSAGASTEKSQ